MLTTINKDKEQILKSYQISCSDFAECFKHKSHPFWHSHHRFAIFELDKKKYLWKPKPEVTGPTEGDQKQVY